MSSSIFSTLSFENFRAFSEMTNIELGKITLLYGQNSAGKSSVIKSLLLLQQSINNSGDRRRGKFVFSGESVDLGSFSTAVFNHETKRQIKIGVEFQAPDFQNRELTHRIQLTWSIGSDQEISQLEMCIDDFRFIFHRPRNDQQRNIGFVLDPSCINDWCAATSQSKDLFSSNDEIIDDLQGGFGFVPIFSSGIIPRIFKGTVQVSNAAEIQAMRFSNIRTYRNDDFRDDDDTSPVNRYGSVADGWSQMLNPIWNRLSNALRMTSYLGPLRREPQRLERYTPTTDRHVGANGEEMLSLMFEQPGLVREVNNYLGLMELPYKVEVVQLGDQNTVGSVISLALKNTSTGLALSPSDVGVGYSQVLPLITQSVLSRNSLICVEQPELHLHPAMQARLGDMFIGQTLGGNSVQFLIETHSESLMLRLLRRVREKRISPDDIKVIYIDQLKNGQSEAIMLPILPSGDFGAPWPHGFFDERLEEFGI